MQITLKQVFFGQPVIQKLANQAMPIKVAFRMNKLLKKIADEYENIEQQRTVLIKKYGKETDDNKIEVNKENVEQFTAEFVELLEEETDLDIEPVNASLLPDSISLTPQEMAAIEFIFSEEKTS